MVSKHPVFQPKECKHVFALYLPGVIKSRAMLYGVLTWNQPPFLSITHSIEVIYIWVNVKRSIEQTLKENP